MRSSSEAAAFVVQADDATTAGAFVSAPLPRGGEAFASREPGGEADPPPEPEPDVEARCRAAFEAGREAARAELPWSEAERLESAIGAFEKAARAFDAERGAYLRSQRGALVDLSVHLAEWILAREVAADRKAVAALVERAVAVLPPHPEIAVHLAPADHALLAAGGAAEADAARLTADPALEPGDVRVEAGAATLDARRKVLLERAREILAPAVDAERADEPAAGEAEGESP